MKQMKHTFLHIGEGGVYTAPTTVSTVVGSCVAVCWFWPEGGVGAMFHGYLPRWREFEEAYPVAHYRYVDTGISKLVNDFKKRNIPLCDVNCLVAGGAATINFSGPRIGTNNAAQAKLILESLPLRAVTYSVGGASGRRVEMNTQKGKITVESCHGRSKAKALSMM